MLFCILDVFFYFGCRILVFCSLQNTKKKKFNTVRIPKLKWYSILFHSEPEASLLASRWTAQQKAVYINISLKISIKIEKVKKDKSLYKKWAHMYHGPLNRTFLLSEPPWKLHSLKIGTTKSIFTREIAKLHLMQGDMKNVSYQIWTKIRKTRINRGSKNQYREKWTFRVGFALLIDEKQLFLNCLPG